MSSIMFIIPLLPILLIIVLVIFAVRVIRRMERRAEERLRLEKENISLQQKQIQEINERLTSIEKILKEVD